MLQYSHSSELFVVLFVYIDKEQLDKLELGGALMKKKHLVLCVIVIFLIGIAVYFNIHNKHTFTLANAVGITKSEQVQPLFGAVKVRGDCDTDVVFTDVETGEEYVIGYITHGVSETIKLEKGKWYTVKGSGNLVLSPVNVRIE